MLPGTFRVIFGTIYVDFFFFSSSRLAAFTHFSQRFSSSVLFLPSSLHKPAMAVHLSQLQNGRPPPVSWHQRRRSPSPSISWQSNGRKKKKNPLHDGTGIKVDLSNIVFLQDGWRYGRDGDAAAERSGDKDGRPPGLIKLPLLTLTRRGRGTILKMIRHTESSLLLEFLRGRRYMFSPSRSV